MTQYMIWDFSFFGFNYNGVIYELSGSATYVQDNGTVGCPQNGGVSVSLIAPPALGGNGCEIVFIPTSSSGGSASLSSSCVQSIPGFINPKYAVMGIIYAPPGSSSNVTYMDTTSVGSTTTVSSSFQNNVGFSEQVSTGIKAGWIVGGSLTLTATESQNYTQGASTSTTNTSVKLLQSPGKHQGRPLLPP